MSTQIDRLVEKTESFRLQVSDTVLFMIDIQEKLVPAIRKNDDLLESTAVLMQGVRLMGVPVIYSEQYPKGLGRTVAKVAEHLPENATLFEKITYTAALPEVMEKLKELNAKKILVIGTETHICVYQTVRDLIAAGYDVHVVEDAVGSRTKENKNNGLRLMENMGAIITNVETVLFDLLKRAGTDEFKAVSKLVK